MKRYDIEARLRQLENWNHEQYLNFSADAGSFYEHEVYQRGAEYYTRAEMHRMASVAIEKALEPPKYAKEP